MAGKYRITFDITLGTTVEPQGWLEIGGTDALVDSEDESSWSYEGVSVDGGQFAIEVTADSEGDARALAEEFSETLRFASQDDIEWEIENCSISEIECIEEPMDMDRAKEILGAFLTRIREMGGVTAEEEEAFRFVLDTLNP